MGRKVCKQCDGHGRIHLEHCKTRTAFDSACTCDPAHPVGGFDGVPIDAGVICPSCDGTGERQRHKNPVAAS